MKVPFYFQIPSPFFWVHDFWHLVTCLSTFGKDQFLVFCNSFLLLSWVLVLQFFFSPSYNCMCFPRLNHPLLSTCCASKLSPLEAQCRDVIRIWVVTVCFLSGPGFSSNWLQTVDMSLTVSVPFFLYHVGIQTYIGVVGMEWRDYPI